MVVALGEALRQHRRVVTGAQIERGDVVAAAHEWLAPTLQ